MTSKHARPSPARRAAGIISAVTGPVLLLIGLAAGSPWLAIIGGIMFAIPALAKVFKGSSKPVKPPKPSRYARYRAWRASLSPEQRMAFDATAFAAMTAAHLALRAHHERVDARLTASVMGTGPGPGRAAQGLWVAKQQQNEQFRQSFQ